MQTELVTIDTRTADERWAAWEERGREQDRKTWQRAIAAAAVAAGGFVLWAFVLLRS